MWQEMAQYKENPENTSFLALALNGQIMQKLDLFFFGSQFRQKLSIFWPN